MNEIALAKQQLREEILLKRKEITNLFQENFTRNLLQLVAELSPSRVLCYQSYPSEPNTDGFFQACEVSVVIPITNTDGTLSWQYYLDQKATEIQSGDLLLIPALAVDHQGNRLGRGKGYFDKAISLAPVGISIYAVIFDREFMDSVPVEAHDRKVAGVVTEAGINKIK